jgi:hypothetical protein
MVNPGSARVYHIGSTYTTIDILNQEKEENKVGKIK